MDNRKAWCFGIIAKARKIGIVAAVLNKSKLKKKNIMLTLNHNLKEIVIANNITIMGNIFEVKFLVCFHFFIVDFFVMDYCLFQDGRMVSSDFESVLVERSFLA